MTSTSETQDQVPNMDEESRRNYIRSIIKENLKKYYTQADPTNTNNTQLMSEAEFETIFGEEDVDDSDEVFDNILQKAQEEFERQKELKKKFPFLESPDDIKKPKNRKRKSKVIEDAINVMNKFKKSLLETKEPEKTISTISTSCTKINKIKTENVPVQNRSTIKIYPKWKTTETYTPIFDLPVNPNWVNKKSSPKSNKMYTLKKIHNWLDTADTDFTAPASCKSIRSNTTRCHSVIDNNKSISSTITSTNPLNSSTPLRSTIVRFRSSSPEYIPYNCDDYSSISVASTLEEEIELPDRRKLKKYYTTNNTPLMSEAEFETLFGEEDADDSNEIFDNILQQSREELERLKN